MRQMMKLAASKLLALAAIAGLLIALQPVSPAAADIGKLRWDTVSTPPVYTPANPQGHVVVPNSEASAVAVGKDGRTVYLADTRNGRLLRSSNGGATWDAIHQNLPPAVLPVYQLAVAPDDEKIVAVVVSGRTNVYVSLDGGFTWNDTALAGLGATEQIAALDISPAYNYGSGTARDYGIATRDPPAAPGRVSIYQDRPNLPDSWVNQAAPAGSYLSFRFPADYGSGFVYVAAGVSAAGTWVNLGTRNTNTNATLWNIAGGYANFPVKIISGVAVIDQTTVVTADLALPSDFSTATIRTLWLGVDNGAGAGGDVYRIDGDRLYRLQCPQSRPFNLAYYGTAASGKLSVGGVYPAAVSGTLAVWRTADPRSSLPAWNFADKPPTGGLGIGAGQARLGMAWTPDGGQALAVSFSTAAIDTPAAWAAGANWLAGSNNDESAFSWSVDDGNTWNQPSYIDTVVSGGPLVGGFNDVGPSEDGKVVYLSSFNTAGFDSLWRSVSLPLGKYWERVRCVNAPGHQPILRLAPGEKAGTVLFWADRGGATNLVERSLDFGQTWTSALNNIVVDDFAPVDRNTVWVLRGTQVCKGQVVDTAWRWGAPVTFGESPGHMLAVQGSNVFIGPAAGDTKIVYSTDGGSNFQVIREPVPPGLGVGNCHVALNPDFNSNRYYYVADDASGGVFRWKLGVSRQYEQANPAPVPHFGIALPAPSTAYAARGAAGQGMDRTIEAFLSLTNQRMTWDQVKDNLGATATFRAEPSSLKVAGVFPGTVIWAIDTANNQLVAMLDSLTEDKPLTGQPRPAPGIEAAVIPLAGNGFNMPFTIRWTASSPLIYADVPIRFEAQVALDPNFAGMVIPPVFVAGSASEGVWLVPTNTLMAGVKYYFRVRVVGTTAGNDIHSPWSDTLILAASPGVAVAQRYTGPNALTPPGGAAGVTADNVTFTWSVVPGTNKYAFWLASDAAMQKTLAAVVTSLPAYTYDKKLDSSTTYYWQVQAVQPAVGDKSAVFTFSTEAATSPSQTAIVYIPPGYPPPPEGYQWIIPTFQVNVPRVETSFPDWVWVIIGCGSLLLITIIILVVRSYRRY